MIKSPDPEFSFDGAAMLTQAITIFNAFSPVLVVAVGIAVGTGLLSAVKSIFA